MRQPHGMKGTPEYNTWCALKQRCYYKNNKRYGRYGGRGITVCERWRYSFENFYEDMGRKPTLKHSIDRIDNDGDYSPENCRWATNEQQWKNRSNTHKINFKGKILTIREWANLMNINYVTLKQRILIYKWPVERALSEGSRDYNVIK